MSDRRDAPLSAARVAFVSFAWANCRGVGHSGLVGWWRNRRENGRRRAIQRQDRGYPGGWHRLAVAVPDSEWVSQFDAAEALGINLGRVGLMIGAGVLQAAENPAKQAGVTLESVEREIEWRRIAPLRSRVWRVISYGLSQI